MPRVRSFPPVCGPGARVLILGSMPGVASLKAGRYYAHPRNVFWKIIAGVFGAGDLSYPSSLRVLKAKGVALWDVLGSCVRKGSSDSAIKSATPNDVAGFLLRHRGIKKVLLNGGKAEECFRLHVLPRLGDAAGRFTFRRLPSTSPAHAALSYGRKLKIWRSALLGERPKGDSL